LSRRILVTAGPTHEPIDAVRYLANRSGGSMGMAIADAAARAGHAVTLLLGPVALDPPPHVTTHRFVTTADLQRLLDEHFTAHDVLIMAAAVADYRLRSPAVGKLERSGQPRTLELEPTPDLVAECARRKTGSQRVIGFALEQPDRLAARAPAKLRRKGLDAIIANPLDTMGAAEIDATVHTAAGQKIRPGRMPKPALAQWLIDWIDQAADH
jgi:phosphopantothenoylcysteine decarboxylase/phosphopantothenate--cysteine ligase